MYHDVIAVPFEPDGRELPVHPGIERVCHEEVRQHRRNRGTLRGPRLRCRPGAIRVLNWRCQPAPDVEHDPPCSRHRSAPAPPSRSARAHSYRRSSGCPVPGPRPSPSSVAGTPPPHPSATGPDDTLFHTRYRLFFRSFSNSSIVTPSTPGAPLFFLTTWYASQIRPFGMSKDFPSGFDVSTRSLPDPWLPERIHPDEPTPSLHPDYRGFTTTTSRSASRPSNGTQRLTDLPLDALPLPDPRRVCQGLPSQVPCESRSRDS